jgi:tetraprenyl-beta-curcumene synthase
MMTRYWLFTYPLLRADLRAWERRAAAIPDAQLRDDALATLRRERLNAAGAALFSTLAAHPDPALLQVLVAFQIAWDYLDTLAERPAPDPVANGAHLHLALVDALVPSGPHADYYRLHCASDDGGYLVALVDACRAGCAALPGYRHVRDAAVAEATRAGAVQSANHGPPATRAPALRAWAGMSGGDAGASWFELAAAASSSLAIHALLALAADAQASAATAEQVHAAYVPWVGALSTLLDSLVDEAEDAVSGEISYIAHYGSRAHARARLREIVAHAMSEARELPSGQRHAVIVAGTIAMYLSKSSAWTMAVRPTTLAVLRACGIMVLPLLVLLRAWRLLQAERRHRPVFSSE